MASSYLRQYNPNTQTRKPYNLPYQAALQELATKTAYFQQGVSQLQQSYKTTLDLDPQFKQNKEYLTSFLNDAEMKVQKAVKSDLGIEDNAAQASKIYQKIFDQSDNNNLTLLKDDQINKFYKEQEKLSNEARTSIGKKGKQGENWNSSNDFYFRNAYNEYLKSASSGDISSIDTHFQNRKGFIPYYDYSDDISDLLKQCKPSKSEETNVAESSPSYLVTNSTNGVNSEKVQGCLSFLNDKAKQQIGIESYKSYYNNKEGLLKDYENLVKNRYSQQESYLNAQMAALNANPKTKQEDKDKLQSMIDAVSVKKKEADTEWDNIVGTDGLKYINNNYESIASTVGFHSFLKEAGPRFSYSDTKHIVSPNAVQMAHDKMNFEAKQTQFVQDNINKRQNSQQSFQLKRDAINFEYDKYMTQYKAQFDNDPNNPNNPNNQPIMVEGLENHSDDYFENRDTKKEMYKSMYDLQLKYNAVDKTVNTLIAKHLGIPPEKLTNDERVNFINTYEKNGGGDPSLSLALKSLSEKRIEINNKRNIIDNANKKALEANKTIGASDKRIERKTIGTKVIEGKEFYDDNFKLNLSDKDLVMLMAGQNVDTGYGVEFRLNKKLGDGAISKYVNGVFVGSTNINSIDNFDKWRKGLKSESKKYNKKIQNIYGDDIITQQGLAYPNFDEKTQKNYDLRVKNMLGYGSNPNINVSVEYQDADGNAYVSVSEKVDGEFSNKSTKDITINNTKLSKVDVLGMKDKYIKIPSLLKKLPNYVTSQESKPLIQYTENIISQLQSGESSEDLQNGYFEMVSPKGIPIKISITNVQGLPVYNVYGYTNTKNGKEWQKANSDNAITDPQKIVQIVNNL